MNKKRNYIKLAIILIATMLITLSASNLYRNYEGNKINNSYISKSVSVINYNELSDAIKEMNSNSLLYVSYIGNKEIYDFEKKLQKIIKKDELEDYFYYVNVNDYLNETNMVNGFNKTVGIVDSETIIFPAIIYFKDNIPTDYIDSKNGILNIADLENLLEKYELEKRDNK